MAPADPIDFTDIKEWIAAYEANPQPSFLTPAQRKAILDLKASLVQDVAAPEIGEEDWVSALNSNSKRRGVEFQYEDVGANGQFKCFCNFKGPLAPERITFPREDCGFVAVDTKGTLDAPSFSKKKDARRYAAKSTVAWLLRQGEVVKFPKRVVPVVLDKTVPLAAPKDGLSRSANTEDEVVAHPLPQTSPPAESKSANGDTLPGDTIEAPDETPDIPATVRVRELSKALGFQAPAYRFSTADNGQQGFYNGCADYGTDAFSFPSGIGYVTDCYSRNGTKEQIAAEVLKHLLVVQAKRKEKLDALTAEFSGDASGGATLK
ncbi:hypothetical protein B0T14DRAFT_441994 [Immersiella caudata]|uniref:Uncharacterized protein n=1 Tax=Immersiella caudata TaxID=314043 RepID=A0AA39U1X5_9PEZI|nr:hypothetical protein B0T14DRAFT_441994 [Immersiella caudata]